MRLKKISSTLLFYLLIISFFLAATYWGSAATTTIAQMIPVERETTVIIDAGHGDPDGGAISCTGKEESSYNLEIANRLNDLLHLIGLHTKMIRTTEASVYTQGETIAAKKVSDLRNRAALVNETDNALLLSVHQNTFSDSKYSGAQVFYSPKGSSKQLAEALQDAFCKTLNPESNRKAKRASGIYLLEKIEKTGVLIECGFLSNAEEEAKLRSAEYQKKISCVIAATVAQFLTK